jgi:addiction module HigA family antidote
MVTVGEYIKEVYVEDMNLSVKDISNRTELSENLVLAIIEGKAEINEPIAEALSKGLGRSSASWLKMQELSKD